MSTVMSATYLVSHQPFKSLLTWEMFTPTMAVTLQTTSSSYCRKSKLTHVYHMWDNDTQAVSDLLYIITVDAWQFLGLFVSLSYLDQ